MCDVTLFGLAEHLEESLMTQRMPLTTVPFLSSLSIMKICSLLVRSVKVLAGDYRVQEIDNLLSSVDLNEVC